MSEVHRNGKGCKLPRLEAPALAVWNFKELIGIGAIGGAGGGRIPDEFLLPHAIRHVPQEAGLGQQSAIFEWRRRLSLTADGLEPFLMVSGRAWDCLRKAWRFEPRLEKQLSRLVVD